MLAAIGTPSSRTLSSFLVLLVAERRDSVHEHNMNESAHLRNLVSSSIASLSSHIEQCAEQQTKLADSVAVQSTQLIVFVEASEPTESRSIVK